MARPPISSLWQPVTLARQRFQLLNLDHPEVDAQIRRDLDAGIRVVYDRRWEVTRCFCHFLLANPGWVAERSVLVLGAGVGLETLVIGRLCHTLYINDLAPHALELCAWQLRHNGMTHFASLPGRYETLDLPSVDLIVGCYLIYSRDTATAMRQLLERCPQPVLLVNDNLLNWQQMLRETARPYQTLQLPDDLPCVVFEARSPEPSDPLPQARKARLWRRALQSWRHPRRL